MFNRKNFTLLNLFICFAFAIKAQTKVELTKITNFHQTHRYELLQEYFSFLSIPNTGNDPEQLRQNAQFILKMMEKRGIQGKLLEADGAIPAVYGEILNPKATTTIIFYAHYDGQPVTPKNWSAGLEPFKPQLVTDRLDKGGKFIAFPKENEVINDDWRIYARAAADDKAGVFGILNAFYAIKQTELQPNINIKFFFEGEEEAGSPNLGKILEKHKNLLASDLWVISDGPIHASGRKQIVFGVRGDVNMNLTVYGAKRPLHSGNYGNWAPNPALKLVQLLASLKDDKGKVLVDGFYDDVTPLSAREKDAIKLIPDPSPMMQRELAFAQTENPDRSFYESISALPTLNINGIVSANVGKLAANVIPTTAMATLDLRLVKGNDAERQTQKVINHIRKQGFFVTATEPTDEERAKYPNIITVTNGSGYNAQRTSMDLPLAQRIVKAVQLTSAEPLVLLPSAGGSLPLFLFETILKTPPITVPVVNYDNNQHAENENLKIGCIYQSIETMAAIMLLK